MLKRIMCSICSIAIAVCLLLGYHIDTLACANILYAGYPDYNCHTLNGGVGNYGYTNRYYYVTSSASTYLTDITSAVDGWIYTSSSLGVTTPISLIRTTTQSSSVFDVYYESTAISGAGSSPGVTIHYSSGNAVNANSGNWGWSKIQLNSSYFSGLVTAQKKATIGHEFGHAFGLEHPSMIFGLYPDDQNRLMTPQPDRNVTSPQIKDVTVINHLYA